MNNFARIFIRVGVAACAWRSTTVPSKTRCGPSVVFPQSALYSFFILCGLFGLSVISENDFSSPIPTPKKRLKMLKNLKSYSQLVAISLNPVLSKGGTNGLNWLESVENGFFQGNADVSGFQLSTLEGADFLKIQGLSPAVLRLRVGTLHNGPSPFRPPFPQSKFVAF